MMLRDGTATAHMSPRVTVAIPLFNSAQFYDSIVSNIESIPDPDTEILISDRHCLDDTITRLQARYGNDSRVRFLQATDGIDWVRHINLLLREGRGTYWRLLPHDDLSPPGSLEALVQALDDNPQTILAYGPTRAIDAGGAPLPHRDKLQPHPVSNDAPWILRLVLDMFWNGYFDGAFKGLLHRRVVLDAGHFIKPTLDLILPERAWLFGMCLLGPLRFVPEATYIKRFHPQSTHVQWQVKPKHLLSVTRVMIAYLRRYVVNSRIRQLATRYLIMRVIEQLEEHRLPGAQNIPAGSGLLESARQFPGKKRQRSIERCSPEPLDSFNSLSDVVFPEWRMTT